MGEDKSGGSRQTFFRPHADGHDGTWGDVESIYDGDVESLDDGSYGLLLNDTPTAAECGSDNISSIVVEPTSFEAMFSIHAWILSCNVLHVHSLDLKCISPHAIKSK